MTRSLIEIALECALGAFVGVTLALLFYRRHSEDGTVTMGWLFSVYIGGHLLFGGPFATEAECADQAALAAFRIPLYEVTLIGSRPVGVCYTQDRTHSVLIARGGQISVSRH